MVTRFVVSWLLLAVVASVAGASDGKAVEVGGVGGTWGCSFPYLFRASTKLTFSVKLMVLMASSLFQIGQSEDVNSWSPLQAAQWGGAVHTSPCQLFPQCLQTRAVSLHER